MQPSVTCIHVQPVVDFIQMNNYIVVLKCGKTARAQ